LRKRYTNSRFGNPVDSSVRLVPNDQRKLHPTGASWCNFINRQTA
jgi:hypothetical protein